MAQPSDRAAAPSELIPLTQVGTAIAALIAGWVALQPRFDRIRMLRREWKKPSRVFFAFYELPQYFNGFLLVCLLLLLLLAALGAIGSGAVPGVAPIPTIAAVESFAAWIYQTGWLLVITIAIVYALIGLDAIARMMVFGAWLLSTLGIPGLQRRFGPNGDSQGWHQAREFLRNQSKAQPFWIDEQGVERAVAAALERMATEAGPAANRAPTPATEDKGERGNIALFGCIIEQIENELEQPPRRWDLFYAALADASAKSHLFVPSNIREHDASHSFGERIRKEVNAILEPQKQPGLALAIDNDTNKAFAILRSRFAGDASKLGKGLRAVFTGRVDTMFLNAALFPRLHGDGMRPQFVKLCLRWEVLPKARPRIFVQPFSVRLGWYLMHLGAIGALSDQKQVNFNGPIDRPLSRIASNAALDGIVAQIETGRGSEVAAVRGRYANTDESMRGWLIRQEADTTLWRMAREIAAQGQLAGWKGNDWRWKFDKRTVTRI